MFDDGKRVALDGDVATCGNCPSTYRIYGTGDGTFENGIHVVVEGDAVFCPCGKNRVLRGANPGMFIETVRESPRTAPAGDGASGDGAPAGGQGGGHAQPGGKIIGNVQAGTKMCLNAAKGRKSGKTNQSYNNCGVESARQIINQATGKNISENDLLGQAFDLDDADRGESWFERFFSQEPTSAPRYADGPTTPEQRQDLLKKFGVPSTLEANNLDNIGAAVSSGKGVIVPVDSGVLWGNHRYDGQGHAVTVTGIEYDQLGRVSNVIINDTGIGHCSNKIPVATWNKAVAARTQRGDADINVTSNPIF